MTTLCTTCGAHPPAFSDRFGDQCWHCHEDNPCARYDCVCAGRGAAPKPNALQSLWGSGDVARDRARRNTVKSMASPGERPQTIYTPQSIIDVCLEVWPEGIAMDPCSGPDSIVPARIKLDGSEGQDGLKTEWMPFTYVNPPFKNLKQWLDKATNEAAKSPEIILLCPVRTHRVWYRRVLEDEYVTTVFLDPLKFHGYAQAFPAPLALHYWGERVVDFKHACRKVSKR